MLISDNNLRKLIWAISFAMFCLFVSSLYKILLKQRNRITIRINGEKREVFSLADLTIFLIITFLASIRLNVGSDYYNYYVKFNSINTDCISIKDLIISFDGFGLLSYIVKIFTNFEYAIFSVIAIFSYGFLFLLLRNEVKDKSTAFTCYMFMGFFANSLNIMKQYIAMIFVMCFYKNLLKKKYVNAACFAVVAVVFHYSALLAILVIGPVTLLKIVPSRKFVSCSIAIGIMFAIFLPQIVGVIIKLIPSASGYGVYVNWRRNSQLRLIIAVAGMSVIYAFLLFWILKYKDRIKAVNETRFYEISFLAIGLCINIASIRIWVVQRVALYFYQFIILVVPTLFQSLKFKTRKRVKQIILLAMFMYLIFMGIFLGENEYYSYNTIFSGDQPIYDAEYNKMFR